MEESAEIEMKVMHYSWLFLCFARNPDTIVAKGSLILSFLGGQACFGELAGLVLGTLLHIASQMVVKHHDHQDLQQEMHLRSETSQVKFNQTNDQMPVKNSNVYTSEVLTWDMNMDLSKR